MSKERMTKVYIVQFNPESEKQEREFESHLVGLGAGFNKLLPLKGNTSVSWIPGEFEYPQKNRIEKLLE